MENWRARLDRWARHWDRLPELTRDGFEFRRPSGMAWPPGLPSCPALGDFYARCDGGTFGAYDFSTMAELEDPSAGWLADSPGLDLKPGSSVAFGSHEYGHTLLWNADPDEVLLYSPDDEGPRRLKRTMEAFLRRLFFPSARSGNESTQLWVAALAELDQLA